MESTVTLNKAEFFKKENAWWCMCPASLSPACFFTFTPTSKYTGPYNTRNK